METMLTRTTSTGCDSRGRRRNAFESKYRSTALLVGVLLLATGMITDDIGKNEFSYDLEEVQRPVTTLYVAGLIDLPISHPVQQGG
jgi:hypothetical protein